MESSDPPDSDHHYETVSSFRDWPSSRGASVILPHRHPQTAYLYELSCAWDCVCERAFRLCVCACVCADTISVNEGKGGVVIEWDCESMTDADVSAVVSMIKIARHDFDYKRAPTPRRASRPESNVCAVMS